MPKTRPYTREELQGLRRADLQRLCKTYDIKGANAKTAVLVEELANYFQVATLQDGVAKLGQQEQVIDKLLEEKINEKANVLIQRHIASLEQRETALQQREAQLAEAWSSIQTYLSQLLATHIDLTTITEGELGPQDHHESPNYESPGSSSHFLGPILVHDRRTVTPPALSPSPSIGGDNFAYSALPMPPRGRSSLGGSSRGFSSSGRPFVSPGREYMDVALNGLSNPNDSPSALATPTSRTMLGTERYRDTRFGDEPVVPWDTPTVDFGRATPNL
ncbi:hypothetical protein Q8F55_008813 [Vanrija albida]|uniref:SAP domain-containing protein n=1 Tax=Vanrija albida TaxID=181172 RepID=A0ABR3PRW4_9TREE